MNILELDSYSLADAIKFNKQLNPRLWKGDKMLPEVREKLLAIADDFKQFLGLRDINVKDITISGSNANYSYTPYSDIDLHLVVDLPEADVNEVYRELFDAKKYQYNDQHDYKIGGYDVELYVENANQPPVSKGVYSILHNDWINIPRKIRSSVDDDAVRSKYEDLKHRIDQAVNSNNSQAMDRLAKKIKAMRQAGLDKHGELGPENLAFKMLRTQGKIKELYDARNAAKDAELSLKEQPVPSKFINGFKEDAGMTWDGVNPTTDMVVNETDPVKEDAGMTWDGVDPTTCMVVNEQETNKNILKDFIKFCVKELKIEHMPIIKLRRDPQWPVIHKTFGRYINDKKTLEVAFGQRHIMDVLRTVAHELTHKHQHERENVPSDAGETGSRYENEANARAGVLMRDYGRLHPELFDNGQLDLEESASGYIPTKKQAKDPRFVMALTKDVQPGAVGKEANKLKLRTDKQGHPQVANANGLFEELKLQLEAFKRAKEDYSPDNPPGPEFKPTMPRGTVRVDVSDMYDWYKLGKSISNLKGTDKSQFGKGPPSTIVSFGDEDTEHKYVKDLGNLELDVTDIDPVDPKQPQGMKRIKTDPTYNVDETIKTPVSKDNDEEQYIKFILGKAKLGRPLTRQEQEYIKTYNLKKQIAESEELDEVRMAPTNLKQFANSPEAEGIMAGFEAELIFRDTTSDEDGDGDMEPDYDMDERCRSLSQIVEFFDNGEYGYLSPRQRNALEENLDERYYEWHDEQMYAAFRDEADDLVREIWLEERPMSERIHAALVDGLDLSDEEADRIQAVGEKAPRFTSSKEQDAYVEENPDYKVYLEAVELADEVLADDVEQSISNQDKYYDSALDDFRDNFSLDDDSGFFDDIGLRWMSDVASEYDLDWPYMTGTGGNDGDRSWEDIGDSLNGVVDMPVKVSSGYHQATRKPGVWIVEPDSSLEPDDREDYGLEIVSPPMPLKQALEKLQQVTDWANNPREGNAYTNESTGLHMGVSIPFKGGNVDYLKLILFLGDEYVLQQYGREANTYTKAAMKDIRSRASSERNATAVLELLKNNLLELAERELAKSTGVGKYTSAHKHGEYIEFRSAGGDWLAEDNAEPGKLENTMMRYAYAMYLAGRPDLERKEYAKKLYKLVASGTDDSTMALFSQFAAGELSKDQLKKQWAEKTLAKDDPRSVAKGNWVVVDNNTGKTVQGQEYSGYTEQEVRDRAKAKLSPGSSDEGFDRAYSIHPRETGRWEVYRDDHGQEETLEIIDADRRGEAVDKAYDKYTGVIPFKVRAYYGDQPATPEKELSPRAKLAKRITQKKQQADYSDPNASSDWEAVYTPTGRVVDTLAHADAEQAQTWRQMVIQQHDFTNQAELIVVRRAGGQAEQQAKDANDVPMWELFDKMTGHAMHSFSNLDQNAAWTQGRQWLQSMGAEDPNTYAERFAIRPKTQTASTNPRPTIQEPQQVRAPNGVPMWEVYDRTDGHVVHNITDHTQREAWAQAQATLRRVGWTDEQMSNFSLRPKMSS